MRFTQYLSEHTIVRDVIMYADLPIMESLEAQLVACEALVGWKQQSTLNNLVETVAVQLEEWAKTFASPKKQHMHTVKQVLANPRKIAVDLLTSLQSTN